MKAKPKTIRTKPAICSSRNWFLVIERPTAAAPAPSRTNTATSPATNGRLETSDPPRRAGLAEPLGLDRRDRGEVAGDERQHAGREERDEARAEGDDHGRAGSRFEARELVVEPALEHGIERLAGLGRLVVAPAAPVPGEQPDDDGAERQPGERQQPRDQLEARASAARRARSGRTGRRAAALISLFESPAAIRARMNAFIRSATGASEVSSVVSQTGQTSSDSSSAAVGRSSLAAAGAASASAASASAAGSHAGAEARSMPASSSAASSTGPAMRRRTLPAASMK